MTLCGVRLSRLMCGEKCFCLIPDILCDCSFAKNMNCGFFYILTHTTSRTINYMHSKKTCIEKQNIVNDFVLENLHISIFSYNTRKKVNFIPYCDLTKFLLKIYLRSWHLIKFVNKKELNSLESSF